MMRAARTMSIGAAIVTALVPLAVGAAAQTTAALPRFDARVRGDFFAGFAGDPARLARGMRACEETLAADPEHAEALVWHGSGLLFQGGTRFRTGDMAEGQRLWTKGLAEMDSAVRLAPAAVAVLAPRGSALLGASRFVSPLMARPLIEQGVADYERILSIQAPYFATLGDHPRSELLFGLAEGYARLGQIDRARQYFERIVRDVPASGPAPRAQQWLATGSLPVFTGPTCVGCHQQP